MFLQTLNSIPKLALQQKQWILFFIFFCLTKRKKNQGEKPYSGLPRSGSFTIKVYKTFITLSPLRSKSLRNAARKTVYRSFYSYFFYFTFRDK